MQGAADTWSSVLVNIGFLVIQFFLVCAWFTLRNGKWTNITVDLLGWGDVLFLLSVAFGLSVFSFLFFYILSLIIICFYWLLIRALGKSNKQVPLAGLQAFLLCMVLSADGWLFHIGLTGDDWAFKLMGR